MLLRPVFAWTLAACPVVVGPSDFRDAEILRLQFEVAALRASRDSWKERAEAAEREAAGARLALAASKTTHRRQVWIAMGEGFVAGFMLRQTIKGLF